MPGRKLTKIRENAQSLKLDDEASTFWERLFFAIGVEGISLTEFCQLENVSYALVRKRLERSERLSLSYRQARETRAQIHADRIAVLSEQVLTDEPSKANQYKISIDTKRWLATVMDRKLFGDKVEQTLNVSLDLNTAYLDQLKTLMSDKPKIIEQPKLIDIVED